MKANKKETIENLILQNKGIIQIADITAKGISKQYATKYLQDHGFERAAKEATLIWNYVMERFLERMSISEYKDKLILKGELLHCSGTMHFLQVFPLCRR